MKKQWKEQIAGRDNLTENPKNVLQGTVAGYPVAVSLDPNSRKYRVAVAATSESDSINQRNDLLAEIKSTYAKVTEAVYQENEFVFSGPLIGKFAQEIRAVLDRMTVYLPMQGYRPCCGCCGETDFPPRLSSINGRFAMLCDTCYEQKTAHLEQNHQAKKARKGNLVTGLVGAFLGSLIGCVLWFGIYQLGYIAGIAGLVAAVCALKGYEMLGGKIDLKGMIISVVLAVVMLFFAHQLCLAKEIYDVFSTEYNITFADAFRSIPDFLEDSEVSIAFYRDLLIGYVLMAVASYSTIRSMYRNASGTYKTERY